jgi:hypothetical protein
LIIAALLRECTVVGGLRRGTGVPGDNEMAHNLALCGR